MLQGLIKPLLTAAAFCVFPAIVGAQTPTPRVDPGRIPPGVAAQIEQRVRSSGLTPDQIRARLRAEGYPESLLDAYLGGGRGGEAAAPTPTPEMLEAVRALGIADSTEVSLLADEFLARQGLSDTTPPGRRRRGEVEPEEEDTLRIAPRDSLGRLIPRARLDSIEADSASFRLFGLDVFRSSTSQFEANLAGPVDPSYRLGPGDRLVLILTGDVEAAYTLDVTREGFIVIPQVGQVYVANLTLAQLDDLLYGRLGRVYSGVRRGAGASTRFSISVARLRSNQIYVIGDVARPGSYRVSASGTALTALYAAGGPTRNGSLRRVEVRRGGAVVGRLDVYDYLLRGDASRDVRLQNGDVVFVPVQGGRVRVVGEVTRPATYEMRPGETLGDLLRAAGGLTPSASARRVQIERVMRSAAETPVGGQRVVLDVTLPAGVAPDSAAFPVHPGDVLRVFPIPGRVRNRVTVLGNVWYPGPKGYSTGMKLSDALRLAGGPKPDVYLGRVLVSRLRSDSTRFQLRAELRDTTGTPVEDLELRPDDEIRLFATTDFRPVRYVAISGAVRRGGRFLYRDGMTLRDLVLLSGGLEEGAWLREAEVARLPAEPGNGVTARAFRVPLDSSYLFERSANGDYAGPAGTASVAATGPEVPLRPYDNVLVLREPDWDLPRNVAVTGEVRFPGTYTLRTKSERLSDLIARAGGLTTEAFAEGVYFYRPTSRVGRIGIDLPSVLRNPRHRDNVVLVGGDSISVSRYSPVVNVTGSVNSPVAVAYVPGKDLEYYISAAGGPTRDADARRAYVTQPNGKVQAIVRRAGLIPDDIPRPRPGSQVYVPAKSPNDRRDLVPIVGAIAQVVAGLTAIILAIVNNN